MMIKALAILILLPMLTPAGLPAQAARHAPVTSQSVSANPQSQPECNGAACDEQQQPHVIVTLPPPAPTPWLLHDRILWAVWIILAIVAYAGVMLALAALKKIERNTAAAVDTATAAAETAHAALLFAQAQAAVERPWILVTAEPLPGLDSSFEIKVSNRGRRPARITEALDQTLFVIDEAQLPAVVNYRRRASAERFVPILLLPGESSTLMRVSREDALELCGSEEQFLDVESWTQKLFLCGRVTYGDLLVTEAKHAHETNWCCWYIHGKSRSAVVPAGTPALNSHT